MKHALQLAFSFLLLGMPALGQSPAKLKQELKAKEASAKKDPDALFEVGKWAAEKSLAADAKRIYAEAVKLKPDHAGANEALGNVLVEGKWLSKKDAEALQKKAVAAEFTAKGFVEVSGVWVEKEHVDDAKKGVFHEDGQLVTKEEKLAFQAGRVRHPHTGELIEAKFLEKAENKYFPIGSEGRWVDEKEADTFHSDIKRPWHVRTNHCTIVSTLAFAKIDELRAHADQGCEHTSPLFGSRKATPARRPVIVIAESRSQYNELGAAHGDGTDAAGVFLVQADQLVATPMQGEVRAAICSYEKDWIERYVRHAAAIAWVGSIAEDAGADLPLWFLHGVGSLTSRFDNDSDAAWFAKQHVQKGGVRNVKSFLSAFAISGEMDPKDIAYNIFQAGLLLRFATTGGDAKVTEAMLAVSASLAGQTKGGAAKAIKKLEELLIDAEPKIASLCKELAAKSQ